MEKIMVVKTELLQSFLNCGGMITQELADEVLAVILENYFFMPREWAEEDESVKQIIPYVCARLRDGEKILVLQRLQGQTEKRLHGMLSIGIGGHISEDDGEQDVLMTGLRRELAEEVRLDFDAEPRFLGIIWEPENAVGRVHLGLAYEVTCRSESFEILEKDKMSGSWELLGAVEWDKLESWSKIVLELLQKNG